jgi:hypothetical protein
MFDSGDAAFQRTSAAPRLGPPALTAAGDMTFVSEERFAFDRHNAQLQASSVQPRLLPPRWSPDMTAGICTAGHAHMQHSQGAPLHLG